MLLLQLSYGIIKEKTWCEYYSLRRSSSILLHIGAEMLPVVQEKMVKYAAEIRMKVTTTT